MIPATSEATVRIVVVSVAILAAVCVCALAFCVVRGVVPDQILLTAFVGITGGLTGTLTGMLINTRSQPPITTVNEKTTTITEAAQHDSAS